MCLLALYIIYIFVQERCTCNYFFFVQVELKETKRTYAMKVVKKELVNDDEVLIVNFLCFKSGS